MASKGANQPAETSAGQALEVVDRSKGMVTANELALVGGESSDFGCKDISVPFLRILQGLSPYVTKGDEKYTKEADTGMIVETVTPRFFDGMEKGLIVVPVMYQRSYTEWAPNRGGLVADYGSDGAIMLQSKKVVGDDGKTRMVTPAGNDLAEAAQYYVFYGVPPENRDQPIDFEQAVMTLAGTQWKQARDWNTNMSRVKLVLPNGTLVKNPLPYVQSYLFKTITQKKDANTFFGWKISPYRFTLDLPNGTELIQAAHDFRKLALEGRVKAQDDETLDDAPNSAAGADDIPY